MGSCAAASFCSRLFQQQQQCLAADQLFCVICNFHNVWLQIVRVSACVFIRLSVALRMTPALSCWLPRLLRCAQFCAVNKASTA